MKPLTMTEERERGLRFFARSKTNGGMALAEILRELDVTREKLAEAEKERDDLRADCSTLGNWLLSIKAKVDDYVKYMPGATSAPPPAPEPPTQQAKEEQAPPTSPAGEFGEPWSARPTGYFANGATFQISPQYTDKGSMSECDARRIVQCVNALAGIPDPEAFIKEAKANVAFARATVANDVQQLRTDTKVVSGREWAAIEKVLKSAWEYLVWLTESEILFASPRCKQACAAFRELESLRAQGKE